MSSLSVVKFDKKLQLRDISLKWNAGVMEYAYELLLSVILVICIVIGIITDDYHLIALGAIPIITFLIFILPFYLRVRSRRRVAFYDV